MAAESRGSGEPPRRFGRHLEGWQLGLLAVTLPLLALWLAAPRPVTPREIPLPRVDRKELRRIQALNSERARKVESEPLGFPVRRFGELLRRVGASTAHSEASRLRAELRGQFRAVRRTTGTEALLRLRAVQTRLFLEALGRLKQGASEISELRELAGAFEQRARRSAWLDENGRSVFSDAELSAFYLFHWTELVGALADPAFRPTLHEARVLYRALIEHPEGQDPTERDYRRLGYVRALEQRDSSYPADLARGVLQFRLGQPVAASRSFLEHLDKNADGPYALRARNYLLAALADSPLAE